MTFGAFGVERQYLSVTAANCIHKMLWMWCSIRHKQKPVDLIRLTGFYVALEASISGHI